MPHQGSSAVASRYHVAARYQARGVNFAHSVGPGAPLSPPKSRLLPAPPPPSLVAKSPPDQWRKPPENMHNKANRHTPADTDYRGPHGLLGGEPATLPAACRP